MKQLRLAPSEGVTVRSALSALATAALLSAAPSVLAQAAEEAPGGAGDPLADPAAEAVPETATDDAEEAEMEDVEAAESADSAAQAEADDQDTTAPGGAEADDSLGRAPETADTSATTNADGDRVNPPFGVELLPAEAYPNDPVRGIPGGSLMWTMNGLQWPYMPKRPGDPVTRVGISGYGWMDGSVRDVRSDKQRDEFELRYQGRVVLRVTPTFNLDDGWFVQTNAEFVAEGNQDRTVANYANVDDAWIRVGKWNVFDIQFGRTQAWEIYHFGMGLDWNTLEREGAKTSSNDPPLEQPYGVTDLWDRIRNTTSLSAHYYPFKWARIEVQGRFGVTASGNDTGVRPVGILDFDWFKLKLGAEHRRSFSKFSDSESETLTNGYGGMAMFVFFPWVELGAGGAQRIIDRFDNDGAPDRRGSSTTNTFGGFLNVRPFERFIVGGGYHNTQWENLNTDAQGNPETQDIHQYYGALQYTLWDQLYIKYVISNATADFQQRRDGGAGPDLHGNRALSHRLRLQMFY